MNEVLCNYLSFHWDGSRCEHGWLNSLVSRGLNDGRIWHTFTFRTDALPISEWALVQQTTSTLWILRLLLKFLEWHQIPVSSVHQDGGRRRDKTRKTACSWPLEKLAWSSVTVAEEGEMRSTSMTFPQEEAPAKNISVINLSLEPQRAQKSPGWPVSTGMDTEGGLLTGCFYHIWDSQCVILITPTPPPSRR